MQISVPHCKKARNLKKQTRLRKLLAKTPEKSMTSKKSNAIVKRVFADNWSLYKWQYFIALILLGTISASTFFVAYIVKNITNDVFVDQNMQAAIYIAIAIFAVFNIR